MANRDMLAEAIADAKALKETAIANAKAALEEAFEPRLKSMLSAKLQEMEEEDLNEVEDEMTEAKKKYKDDDRKDGGESKETKRTEKMKYGKDLAEAEDMDEEMDLDELLAEIDGELEEDARTDAEEEGYLDGMKDEKEDMEDDMEDEDIDLEEMSEDDLKSFIEDVIRDMVEGGELEAGDEFEVEDDEEGEDEEVDVDVDVEDEETVDENARTDAEEEGYLDGMHDEKEDLDEGIFDKIKKYIDDSRDAEGNIDSEKLLRFVDKMDVLPAGTVTKGMEKSGAGKTSSIGETEEMDEMKKELDELRSELYEVNLLNAKLLYTNKIFRAKNLQEAQKVKVLEAFDKASNVKEVKLVYETLNEGIKTTPKTQIKESLGSASKAVGVAQKAPIVEIDAQVARWQKLAGIK